MPEFHLRRKKKGKDVRRHTLGQERSQQQQLQRALDMYEEHNEIILGPNEISVDDAVAGRRVNAVDDNVIKSTRSSNEPTIKANIVRKISSKYSECIYLRYGSEMRRCPMPTPITLSTIKQMFVNMFDLTPVAITNPAWHLFILDRSNTWKPLDMVSIVYDHCTILLVDSSDIGTLIPSPVSIDNRTSRCSTGTPDNELLFSPSPNELRPLSWNESSPDVLPRPKSLDISLLPSVTGDTVVTPPPIDHPLSPPFSNNSEVSPDHVLGLSPSNKSPLGLQMVGFYNRVQHLKHDLFLAREEHLVKMNEMNLHFQLSKERLLSAMKGLSSRSNEGEVPAPVVLPFREERLALDKIKKDYNETSQKTRHDLSLLQAVVEELRVDTVERRCKTDPEEIMVLTRELKEHQSTLLSLQNRYTPLETKLKEVMKEELKIIVEEERLVEDEPLRLEDSVDICSQLSETLEALQHFSSIQQQRVPQVPVISSVAEPDRAALMISIASLVPNHSQRLENIQVAEDVIHKRKQELSPSRRALKEFEQSLKHQQGKLKSTDHLSAIEAQQENKLKNFYMDEKIKRQQELEKEIQIRDELKRKKKQKEFEAIRAKFQEEKDKLKREEEKQKKELKKVQLEKERLQKQTEEEKKKLDELKRQQEEQKIAELKQKEELKQQEEKRKRLEEKRILEQEREKAEERRRKAQQELQEKAENEERQKRLTEARILETEREKTDERRKREKERLKQVEEQLKKEVEKDKLEEKRKHEEQQRLLNDLLSNSPDVKARRKDFIWRQIQERAQMELEEEKHKKEKTNQLRSQQSIMDSVTLGATSTPTIYTAKPSTNEYYNNGHRSHPSLPQANSSFTPEFATKRFHHLESFDSSYPSDPLHRKLSTEIKPPDPSYDTLEKLFKSEENVTTTTSSSSQNHYDLPWHSKKLPFGSVQPRRGTLETINASPGHHKRNKSEGVAAADPQFKPLPNRENLTPSPAGSGGGYHHTYIHTSHTPPPTTLTSSHSAGKIKSPPVYEDIPTPNNSRGSPSSSTEMSLDPLLLSLKATNGGSLSSMKSSENGLPQGSTNYPHPTHMPNGVLPTYSQVIRTNHHSPRMTTTSPPPVGHRNRSHTTNGRMTSHYPLTSNNRTTKSVKTPPSVSYV